MVIRICKNGALKNLTANKEHKTILPNKKPLMTIVGFIPVLICLKSSTIKMTPEFLLEHAEGHFIATKKLIP